MKLTNQSIIITGGASGIGYQAALQLAEQGANL
jgi:NAD(P)-dependent dehydrogenase (short-subunit alcohol dehydrogenase family)